MMRSLFLSACVLLTLSAGAEPDAPEITNVFVAGTEGINTYRIPSILVAPDGSAARLLRGA